MSDRMKTPASPSKADREKLYGKPLAEEEVVIHVAKGMADRVRIEELDADRANAEITVRVSKRRNSANVPLLGVMVK